MDGVEAVQSAKRIGNPAAKFAIAFFGGFLAVYYPKLSAAIADFDQLDVNLLDPKYITIAVAFAFLIGAVTLIVQWGERKEPKEVLMAALGIPALISGLLNTTIAQTELDRSNAELENARQEIIELKNVSEYFVDGLGGLIVIDEPGAAGGEKSSSLIEMFAPANAWASGEKRFEPDTGGKAAVLENSAFAPRYVVVLDISASKEDALVKAASLREQDYKVKVLGAGERFLLIKDQPLATFDDATAQVEELSRNENLNPGLLDMKKGR